MSDDISEECVIYAAQKCLLPPTEVKIWFDHLLQIQKTRKTGAEKAAATRCRKQEQPRADNARAAERGRPDHQDSEQDNTVTFCGVCCEVYAEVTDEPEDWIQCDSCLKWFHFECANIDPKSVPEQFVCDSC